MERKNKVKKKKVCEYHQAARPALEVQPPMYEGGPSKSAMLKSFTSCFSHCGPVETFPWEQPVQLLLTNSSDA